jgi:cell division GTPase FtsZ
VPDAAPTGNAVSLVLSIGGAGSNTVNIAIQ